MTLQTAAVRHLPSEDRLTAYAAGSLSPPEAVVMAAHLALVPESAAYVRRLQAVGGELLEQEQPVALSADALARALARVEADGGEVEAPPPLNDMPELPEPLRRYALGRWRRVAPGFRIRPVDAPTDGKKRVFLLEMKPGHAAPHHTHDGDELTVTLKGAYRCGDQIFRPGDLEEADCDIRHQPTVEGDDVCLCVAALEGDIQLAGPLRWLFQPFARI